MGPIEEDDPQIFHRKEDKLDFLKNLHQRKDVDFRSRWSIGNVKGMES